MNLIQVVLDIVAIKHQQSLSPTVMRCWFNFIPHELMQILLDSQLILNFQEVCNFILINFKKILQIEQKIMHFFKGSIVATTTLATTTKLTTSSTRFNQCIAMPCLNNGLCTNFGTTFTCTCQPGIKNIEIQFKNLNTF